MTPREPESVPSEHGAPAPVAKPWHERARERVAVVLPPALAGALLLGSAAYVLIYLALCFIHLRYPFELEWMEGGAVQEVQHILSGKRLYHAPAMDFTPFIYAPLYFYVSAAVSKVVGAGFISLRLVSVLASLGNTALIARLVHAETRSKLAAAISAGVFLGSYRLGSSFFDLARVDSLFLFFLLAALHVLRFRESPRWRVLAGVLLTLAFLTKQTAVLVAGPLVLWSVVTERRRSVPFVAASVGFVSASVLLMNLAHGGWYSYYAFWVPRQHPSVKRMFYDFWLQDLFEPFTVSLVAAAFFFALATSSAKRLYAAAFAGAIAVSWSGRIHAGGWTNVNIPTYAMLAILLGLGFDLASSHAARAPAWSARLVPLGAAAIQLAVLAYDPRKAIPSDQDKKAGYELLERLRSIDGEVFMPAHGYMLAMAGKSTTAHEMAMSDVLGKSGGRPGAKLKEEVVTAIREKRFAAVILDTEFMRKEVEKHYRRQGDVFGKKDKDVFYPIAGMKTRPKGIYVPK
jgi:hypothetical protein